jgi:hypothetical protein
MLSIKGLLDIKNARQHKATTPPQRSLQSLSAAEQFGRPR